MDRVRGASARSQTFALDRGSSSSGKKITGRASETSEEGQKLNRAQWMKRISRQYECERCTDEMGGTSTISCVTLRYQGINGEDMTLDHHRLTTKRLTMFADDIVRTDFEG